MTDEPTIDTIISELREAYEAGTPGPWEWSESALVSGADAELIVKAHNYLPDLLLHIERQGNVIKELQDFNASYGRELAELREQLGRFEAVDPWAVDNMDTIYCVGHTGCHQWDDLDKSTRQHDALCAWAGVGE